jgi:Nucleotidyltransferase domain
MAAGSVPERVQRYLDDVARACGGRGRAPVSLVLFGSAARGALATVSDVDLIVVMPDDTTPESRRGLREAITAIEIAHGFRPAAAPGAVQARVERAAGHLASCWVCTRSDFASADVARVLDLKRWEAPLVDRILFASMMASAVTVSGVDLLSGVAVPPVRRLDILKALFISSSQLVLSANMFLFLPDATRYAMGALKHSLHSCFFCYHRRTAALEQEVAFFERRLGPTRVLHDLLSLRREYNPSFGFVMRCFPTVLRLHVATARDNRFEAAERAQA